MAGVALLGFAPPEPPEPLDCWTTTTLVEPGVAPGALPITSTVVLPPWSVAVPVNTPLPTALAGPVSEPSRWPG